MVTGVADTVIKHAMTWATRRPPVLIRNARHRCSTLAQLVQVTGQSGARSLSPVLAQILRALGQPEAARPLQERALAITEGA
jgi:hypothetical protein